MIASDTQGEIVAFGHTVPFITTQTPVATVERDVKHLINRVAAKHRAHYAELPDDKKTSAVLSVPVPVYPLDSDHINKLHFAAIMALDHVVRALDDEGFTIMSCTPVAMGDEEFENTHEGVAPGYIVYAALPNAAEHIMDDYDDYRFAGAWTDRANQLYGETAVEKYKETMTASMESVLRKLAGETDQ